jgi:hypothetical protein
MVGTSANFQGCVSQLQPLQNCAVEAAYWRQSRHSTVGSQRRYSGMFSSPNFVRVASLKVR